MNNATPRRAPTFKIGDPLSYGLWDRRQIPCTVAANDRKTGLPRVLRVRETIAGLCKEGAEITLEPEFWEGFAP
jgi:hypothetical protein